MPSKKFCHPDRSEAEWRDPAFFLAEEIEEPPIKALVVLCDLRDLRDLRG